MPKRLRVFMCNKEGKRLEYSRRIVIHHMLEAGFKEHQAEQAFHHLEKLHSRPEGSYENGQRRFIFELEDDRCALGETQQD